MPDESTAVAGKVIVVTGAARSIGKALSDHLQTLGAIVIRTDVDATDSEVERLDVTSEPEWNAIVAQVIAEHGKVDGLVSNAALLFRAGSFWDEPTEEFQRMLDVNVMGPWLGTKVVSKAMADTGGGSIVNFSSTSGLMAAPSFTGYGTTRWAVRGFSKHVALGLAEHGVRVNTVHPHGIVGSSMVEMFSPASETEAAEARAARAASNPTRRSGTFADVSAMVTFLLSDDSTFITGREFVIDGGATLAAAQ